MSNLGDCDCAADIVVILGFAWSVSISLPELRFCSVPEYSMVDIHISLHANQFVQLSGDPIFLGFNILNMVLQVLLGPGRGILIDPVPIIRIVKHGR
jgi:uncharacterized membrane protein